MSGYAALKFAHIVSAALLFGTGLGTAFFMLMAVRSENIETIRVTTRHVVIADWLFTAPAVVVQPVTGLLLMRAMGLGYDSAWFAAVAVLYAVAGACWLPVVAIQYRLRALAGGVPPGGSLPGDFHRLFRWWIRLGIPAFSAVVVLYVLMVAKIGL